MPLHRRSFLALGTLAPLGALLPAAARAQDVEPWDALLAGSLAAFDQLHAVRPPSVGVPESREWELALIDAVIGVLEGCRRSVSEDLLQLARDFVGDYTEGVGRGDETFVTLALLGRDLLGELAGVQPVAAGAP